MNSIIPRLGSPRTQHHFLTFALVGAMFAITTGGCSPRVAVKPVVVAGKTSVAATKGAISVVRSAVDALSPARRAGRRDVQVGIASWYGEEYHGRRTANGEVYNMYALTAAHRFLDFDTHVRVTNLENARSVVVRINDRGPFKRGRIIDLSYAAASKLDMVEAGVQEVRLQVLR